MSGRVPPSSRARSRKPLSNNRDVRRGAALYERFSGHQAEQVGRIDVPALPRAAVCIGECDGLLYTTVRDGVTEKYIHKFAHNDKPLLCVTPDGKQILLIGGRYTFTERGIVDASDPSRRRR